MNLKSKAILFMLLAGFSFSLMAVMVKLTPGISVGQKLFFRNLIAMFIAFFISKKTGASLFGKKQNQIFLLSRSLLGLSAMALYFWSIDYIFLADATMLNHLSPFFVTILAWLFLKEKMSKLQVPALFTVFFASLLIIKPKLDLSILPTIAGAFSAILSGTAYIIIRHLSTKEHPATIVFYFSFVSTLIALPLGLIDFTIPNILIMIYLLGIGVFAASGQLFMTYAYKLAKASEISILFYINVIFSGLFGFLIWSELPDIWSIIGGVTIIGVSAFLFRYNKKHNPDDKQSEN